MYTTSLQLSSLLSQPNYRQPNHDLPHPPLMDTPPHPLLSAPYHCYTWKQTKTLQDEIIEKNQIIISNIDRVIYLVCCHADKPHPHY